MTDHKLFNVVLGAIVAHRRGERTQRELAALLGISQSHLAHIEKGDSKVTAHLVTKLAEVLKFSGVGAFYSRVEATIADTKRAADAIKPGSLERVDPRGLVQFVVALKRLPR